MFSWQFSTKKEKSSSWYTIALIVSIALIIWWYMTGLYIMSIVIIILVWVYFLVENNSPDELEIEINDNWILVWEIFYDYPKLESFWIIYNKNVPLFLRIRLKTRGFKLLDIPLDANIKISELRAFLLNYIEEDEKSEISSLERLMYYMKL